MLRCRLITISIPYRYAFHHGPSGDALTHAGGGSPHKWPMSCLAGRDFDSHSRRPINNPFSGAKTRQVWPRKRIPTRSRTKKNLYTESCQCRLRLPWIRAFDHQIVTAPKMRFQHSCYGLSVFREHRISFAHPVCAFPVAAGERRQCHPTPRTHDWIPAKKCPRFLTHSTKPRACLNRTPIVRRTPPL